MNEDKMNKTKKNENKNGMSKELGLKLSKLLKSDIEGDEDLDFLDDENILDNLNDETEVNNSYCEELSKMDENEKREMENEIRTILEGNLDEFDVYGLLEGSQMRELPNNNKKSNTSDSSSNVSI